MSLAVAVLGLGEAGAVLAADLARAGAVVLGYDPRVPASGDVRPAADAAQACRGADLVLSVNSAADALDALTQGLPGCAPATIWADLNTAAPASGPCRRPPRAASGWSTSPSWRRSPHAGSARR